MEDLQRALHLQRAGKTAEAESVYRDILAKSPDPSTTLAALMNLGGLLRETGRWVAADKAIFVRSEDIRAPMGISIVSFAADADTAEIRRDFDAEPIRWTDVLELVRREHIARVDAREPVSLS